MFGTPLLSRRNLGIRCGVVFSGCDEVITLAISYPASFALERARGAIRSAAARDTLSATRAQRDREGLRLDDPACAATASWNGGADGVGIIEDPIRMISRDGDCFGAPILLR